MNRQECKIGMKVCLIQDIGFGRQKRRREGKSELPPLII